jgi:hypothetical protein
MRDAAVDGAVGPGIAVVVILSATMARRGRDNGCSAKDLSRLMRYRPLFRADGPQILRPAKDQPCRDDRVVGLRMT